jgi:hypothetical protein
MMTRKEYIEAIGYVTAEERYKRLVRLISSRLDRDLTGKEISYISWMSRLDMETCEVFEKLFEDIGG